MRFEIKNPNKPHTFTFNLAPEKHPFYYFGRVSGKLNGRAQITRSFDCRYDLGKNCDSLKGITLRTIKLNGGTISVGDTTDYYGGKVILKYIPYGSVKGELFIDVRVP